MVLLLFAEIYSESILRNSKIENSFYIRHCLLSLCIFIGQILSVDSARFSHTKGHKAHVSKSCFRASEKKRETMTELNGLFVYSVEI